MTFAQISVSPEIEAGLLVGAPVVALESTLISHGLPWPVNRETALEAEDVIRAEGALPATIGVWQGTPVIGLTREQIDSMALDSAQVLKASRRDLAAAIVQGKTAATTVAATMFLAHQVGIRLFATGGIGGVHPGAARTGDVSADLPELARTPVAVVCAGAKNILDLPATLEWLETNSVPVVGLGTDTFPAFYLLSSGLPLSVRVDSPEDAARLLLTHWQLAGAGLVLAQPVPNEVALDPAEWDHALHRAEQEADTQGIHGPALTPFLLGRLAILTNGKTLVANRALIVHNARLAARIACQMCHTTRHSKPEALASSTICGNRGGESS